MTLILFHKFIQQKTKSYNYKLQKNQLIIMFFLNKPIRLKFMDLQ